VSCGETHLWCSVTGTIKSYPSLHAFGLAWCEQFQQDFMADAITWKRFEPDGNIFDTLAALLLNQQLEDLAALKLPARQRLEDLERRFDSITDRGQSVRRKPNRPHCTFNRYRQRFPSGCKRLRPRTAWTIASTF